MSTKRKVAKQCKACGLARPDYYGIPDPCLPTLPGVFHACCGHGIRGQAYVAFVAHTRDITKPEDVLRGDDAIVWQRANGGNPADPTFPWTGASEPGWVRVRVALTWDKRTS